MAAGTFHAENPEVRTLRILVVEDDPITREGLVVVLRREGYEAISAANGEEALARLRSEPLPDLILLDMLMPILDGWHFLDRLRNEAVRPTIPIILLTTLTILSLEWAQAHGCCGFIRKPIDPEEMLKEMRTCLSAIGREHP
jgi:CheY-like chemotaxis protein